MCEKGITSSVQACKMVLIAMVDSINWPGVSWVPQGSTVLFKPFHRRGNAIRE